MSCYCEPQEPERAHTHTHTSITDSLRHMNVDAMIRIMRIICYVISYVKADN